MLKKIFVIVYIISFFFFIYGVYKNFVEVESNSCDMTYMFDVPQFKRVHVTSSKFFSNYGLYYYYEGKARIDIKSLNGAPVLFVPGNGGSYKQARSLASVALRMGRQSKNHVHLDYFTIDYNEELSAFYGGYLVKQKKFLQLCIKAIAKLYSKPTNETVKIAIVGHSMGGVVAKSVLCEEKIAKHIENIIFLSTPLDRPVVNFDSTINGFYEYANYMLQEKCTPNGGRRDTTYLNDVLLISIGGGVRDLQVPAGLTSSRYTNIHSMTSAIPKVWLSCDHLSIVWCLQLMKVINKFLFDISVHQPENYVVYKQDFKANLQLAYKHFVGNDADTIPINSFDISGAQNNDLWLIETHQQHHNVFKRGLQNVYNQLFPLEANSSNGAFKIYIEIVHNENHDWLYGCTVEETQSRAPICKKIISLAHHISCIPAKNQKKTYALLNMQDVAKSNDWTHILVRLPASTNAVSLRYDIHNPTDRSIRFKALRWVDIFKEPIVLATTEGAAYMQLIIENVYNAYFAIQINVQKIDCSTEHGDIIIKTSASWAKGFDKYHTFEANERDTHIIVNAPVDNNSSIIAGRNHIYVDIFLEPSCRLSISQQFSFQHSIRRIIQQVLAYLPAHLTAVFIVILAQHCLDEELSNKTVLKKLFTGFFQFESMLITIVCHILQVYLPNAGMTENTHPLLITVMLHGTAIIVSTLIALSVSTLLTLSANVFMILMPRISSIIQISSFPYIRRIFTLRLTLGIVIVSISLATCCGIGLALTYFVYFLWLSNVYKEQLLNQKFSGTDLEEVHKQQNNFLLHLKLLQVLLVLTSLNAVEILAWIIRYPSLKQIYFDTQTVAITLMLISWTFFWEMEDLAELYNNKTIKVLLYGSAALCILYSQENVFTLNYIIAFVYISFLLLGSWYKLKQFTKASRKN